LRNVVARIVACALLAGCTKVGTASDTTADGRRPWTHPHELRISSQVEPNTIDPLLAANTTEDNIDHLLFDNLVSVDAKGNDIPMLAATVPTLGNGGISRDGLTITYHLRPGVVWSDGVPLTSKDVKFSWSAIMNPNNNVLSQTGYALVASVDTPNPTTVVFHMKQKFAPAIDTLFAESDTPYEVVPEHVLGKVHDINNVPFNSSPIGSGPFKLKEWVHGDHLTLIPNDHYFLGKPKLTSISIRFIPDENTELNALRTHDSDWQFEASPQEYTELKTIPDLVNVLQDRNEYERIQINTQHAPLGDPRVRRAIAYAIDRAKLTTNLTGGSGALADQDHPPFMWAYAANVTRYGYDPAKARALLHEAGLVAGPDGMLSYQGQKVALSLVYNQSNKTRRDAVVQVQAMLKEVGLAVEPKGYSGALLFAAMGQNGILTNGKFDLAWTGWVAGADPDQSSIFLCADQPPHGNNETHYCNAELDAAENAALTDFDRSARKKDYAKLEAILTRDVPELPIWWPRQIQPVNPDFKNFTPNPVTETWNSYTWDI